MDIPSLCLWLTCEDVKSELGLRCVIWRAGVVARVGVPGGHHDQLHGRHLGLVHYQGDSGPRPPEGDGGEVVLPQSGLGWLRGPADDAGQVYDASGVNKHIRPSQ